MSSQVAERIRGSQYTAEQRRQAAIQYAIHGSLRKVQDLEGIPDATLSNWIRQPWWESLMSEIRTEANALIRSRSLETLHQAFDNVQDRLANGDVVIVKTAEGVKQVRKPVSLRDAAVTAAIMFDKRQILDRQPTSITGRAVGEDIAEQLTAWMRAQKARTIEAPVQDAQLVGTPE